MTEVSTNSSEFIEAAGLERSGTSGRKSSVEKLLEESLNTGADENQNTIEVSSPSPVKETITNGLDTSLQAGVKTTPERPQNLKSDQFIQDAGLSRTGRVARKSSMERLLEDQLQTWEPETEEATSPTSTHRYTLHRAQTMGATPTSPTTPTSPSSSTNGEEEKRRRFSSSASVDESGQPKQRRNSIYKQKQIEAPTATVGNRIASRTSHLFKQYEKDMASHEAKPLEVDAGESSNTRRRSYERAVSTDEKSKVDIAREQKAKELEEIKIAYQQRLLDDEREQNEERLRQRENQELKYSKHLGSVKDRYLSVAKGDSNQENGDEDQVDNAPLDKNGEKIERSDGKKEQVVKSSDGVGNIRARFGSIGQSSWKKRNEGTDTATVDVQAVSSARSLFKNLDVKKDEQKSLNRPTTRKVKDPKELMEMRKKATYGDDEEIPQDGVIKKSVVIDESELSNVNRREALDKYEELEKSVNSPSTNTDTVEKPRNRLISDEDALEEVMRRSDSLSGSETGEVRIDTSGDVSGYEGSVSPCSPTSEMSDDYNSDTPKEEEADKVPNHVDEGFESFQEGVVADGE